MAIPIPLSQTGKHAGKFTAFVSHEDEILASYTWYVSSGKLGYACRKVDGKHVLLHRVVLERALGITLEKGQVVDHIDMNTMNNTRENLRLANQSLNNANRRVNPKSGTGVKNVHFLKAKKLYRVEIQKDGKVHRIGKFKRLEDAITARDEAIDRLFGEFGRKD